jgi:hypothetical protein
VNAFPSERCALLTAPATVASITTNTKTSSQRPRCSRRADPTATDIPIRAATARRPIAKRNTVNAITLDWPVPSYAIAVNAVTSKATIRVVRNRHKSRTIHEKNRMH